MSLRLIARYRVNDQDAVKHYFDVRQGDDGRLHYNLYDPVGEGDVPYLVVNVKLPNHVLGFADQTELLAAVKEAIGPASGNRVVGEQIFPAQPDNITTDMVEAWAISRLVADLESDHSHRKPVPQHEVKGTMFRLTYPDGQVFEMVWRRVRLDSPGS